MSRILIADDQNEALEALRILLKREASNRCHPNLRHVLPIARN